jgi:hypothetical protein
MTRLLSFADSFMTVAGARGTRKSPAEQAIWHCYACFLCGFDQAMRLQLPLVWAAAITPALGTV